MQIDLTDSVVQQALKTTQTWADLRSSIHKPGLFKSAASHFSVRDRRLVAIMSEGGIVANRYNALHALRHVGESAQLDLSIVAASLVLESGGENIYGSDPRSAWMNEGPHGHLWHQAVTKDNYAWFKEHVDRGYVSNGVGPSQLTSVGLQAAADKFGGCWKPYYNMVEGFIFLREMIRAAGSVELGFQHYNGSGPAAVEYGKEAQGHVNWFHDRFAKVK